MSNARFALLTICGTYLMIRGAISALGIWEIKPIVGEATLGLFGFYLFVDAIGKRFDP